MNSIASFCLGSVKELEDLNIVEQYFDEKYEEIICERKHVIHSKFVRIGIKSSSFSDCSFCQCVMIDVYARKAVFKNVNFTGSIFVTCDFSYAQFDNCNFEYCKFYGCLLPVKEIERCLPTKRWNLRKELANNLKVNFDMIGKKGLSDHFLEIEIRARLKEKWNIVWSTEEHYEKYNSFARLKELGKYVSGNLLFLVTGCGIKWTNVLWSYLIILTFLTMSFAFCSNGSFLEIWLEGFAQSLGVSFSSNLEILFDGCSLCEKLFVLFCRLVGVIYLAILTTTLYRKIAK